jgi:subtilisin
MADSTADAGRGYEASATGRYVVVLSDEIHGDDTAMTEALRSVASVTSIASTRDFAASAVDPAQIGAADATIFSELGVAVVVADPDQATALSSAAVGDRRILAVEPERVFYAVPQRDHHHRPTSDGVTGTLVVDGALVEGALVAGPAVTGAPTYVDTPTETWGLTATRAVSSNRTGQGISVAVLDTGFALDHPDFAGRHITARSFVRGESARDGHGHGTHCVGTSCGPAHPPTGRRYGVATAADIFVGKVLNNRGSGTDTNILAGMNWAIANGCRVISMSLGADVPTVSVAYETVGQRALAAGTLIVAAAGNNATRAFGNFGFVGVPANSPSIMAVGALDSHLAIADFSARSNPVAGGEVNIAAPGVAVYSSWPMPQRYNTISGTSMATPHVAGIAALWSEATGVTGSALWAKVEQSAQGLNIPAVDVGAGLVQAPQ